MWVGAVWARNKKEEFVAARRVPGSGNKTSGECFFSVGGIEEVPEDGHNIISNVNKSGLVAKLAQQFGIGEMVVGEDEKNIGARSVAPYLFLNDDTIISSKTLLRGMETDRRQNIIDSFPYIIGAIDEESVRLSARLRAFRHKERALVKDLIDAQAVEDNRSNRGQILVSEAIELGLIDQTGDTTDVAEALSPLLSWQSTPASLKGESRLQGFYGDEQAQVENIEQLQIRKRSAEELKLASSHFHMSVDTQYKRLEPIGLLRDIESNECPLCRQELNTRKHSGVGDLEKALKQLSRELDVAARDTPRLDKYIRELEGVLRLSKAALSDTRTHISAIVRERENIQRGLNLDARRHRFVGKLSLLLGVKTEGDDIDSIEAELAVLRDTISELEELVGDDARIERILDAVSRINILATRYMETLPFDDHYQGSFLEIKHNRLSANLITESRAIPMEAVGSDENWLTIHVSIAFALHRFFGERERPVPGLLVIDQLSRPYFPERSNQDPLSDEEEEKLIRYVDFVFAESKKMAGFQVLMLEHAQLRHHTAYQAAVEIDWAPGTGLVPSDWPQL